MTTQQHPTQPGWTPQPPHIPPPKPKPFYKRTWFIVTAALVGLMLAGLVVLGALLGAVANSVDEAVSPAQDTIKTSPAAPSTVDVAPTESYSTPRVAHFRIKVIETGREHFGSAGDNVEYELELEQVVSATYDPDKEYKLKYQVTGSEDGPSTDTIVIRGDSYEQPYEGIASTRRNVKLSAKILSIREA